MKPYDRSSKWLLDHHGDSLLRLAGVTDVTSWRAVPAEVVQPRQLPDGLIEAHLAGRDQPDWFLVEIATYPERRVSEQMLRGALSVYLDRRILPEVVTLVLHPKGRYRVPGSTRQRSRLRRTSLNIRWSVVELWNVPASQLLAANDVGLIPWVPLAQSEQPPEVVLRECRERIDRQAGPNERENLLAVIQVLARLRYNLPSLLAILGGRETMIESPLIQEIVDEALGKARRKDILRFLEDRFGVLPSDLANRLDTITDEDRLRELVPQIFLAPDLNTFLSKIANP